MNAPRLSGTFIVPILQMRKRSLKHQVPLPNTQLESGGAWNQTARLWNLLPNPGPPLLLNAELLSLGSTSPLQRPWVDCREIRAPPEFACKAQCIFLGEDPQCFRGVPALKKAKTLHTAPFSGNKPQDILSSTLAVHLASGPHSQSTTFHLVSEYVSRYFVLNFLFCMKHTEKHQVVYVKFNALLHTTPTCVILTHIKK